MEQLLAANIDDPKWVADLKTYTVNSILTVTPLIDNKNFGGYSYSTQKVTPIFIPMDGSDVYLPQYQTKVFLPKHQKLPEPGTEEYKAYLLPVGYAPGVVSKRYIMRLNKPTKDITTQHIIECITKKNVPINTNDKYILPQILPTELGRPGIPAAKMHRNDITPGKYKEFILTISNSVALHCYSTYVPVPGHDGWVCKHGLVRYIAKSDRDWRVIGNSGDDYVNILILVEYNYGTPLYAVAVANNEYNYHTNMRRPYNQKNFRYAIQYDSKGYFSTLYTCDEHLIELNALLKNSHQYIYNFKGNKYWEYQMPGRNIHNFLVQPQDTPTLPLKDGISINYNPVNINDTKFWQRLSEGRGENQVASVIYWINGLAVTHGNYLKHLIARKIEFNKIMDTVTGNSQISGILGLIGDYSNTFSEVNTGLVDFLSGDLFDFSFESYYVTPQPGSVGVALTDTQKKEFTDLLVVISIQDNKMSGEKMSMLDNKTKVEGYWASNIDPEKDEYKGKYPWPVPTIGEWPDKQAFIDKLTKIEASPDERIEMLDAPGLHLVQFRGIAHSRLENTYVDNGEYIYNGPKFTIRWPAGYLRHYVIKHNIRPSKEFQDFVMNYVL